MTYKNAKEFREITEECLSQECPRNIILRAYDQINKNAYLGYYKASIMLPLKEYVYLKSLQKTFVDLGFKTTYVQTENYHVTFDWSEA